MEDNTQQLSGKYLTCELICIIFAIKLKHVKMCIFPVDERKTRDLRIVHTLHGTTFFQSECIGSGRVKANLCSQKK